MVKKVKKIMTVDLEGDIGCGSAKGVEVVPKLLDFFSSHNISATFFVVSSLLEKYEDLVKEIARKHEVASHSHSHKFFQSSEIALDEMSRSFEELSSYGFKVKGFRAPGFVVTKDHFKLLKQVGYTYDSSLARFFPGRYRHLSLPSKPFVRDGVLEFPMPTFVYPSVNAGLSYLKLLDPVSRGFGQPYMFYLHPWEFLEKKDLGGSGGFVHKLLQRNTGAKAWDLFERYVTKKEGVQWVSCERWVEK